MKNANSKTFGLISTVKNSLLDFVNEINTVRGISSKRHLDFLQWADENGYTIELLEFTSNWEAKFPFWEVSRGSYCAKTILLDKQNNRTGAYLLIGSTAPSWVLNTRFVEPKEIRFNKPFTIGKNKELIPFGSKDQQPIQPHPAGNIE